MSYRPHTPVILKELSVTIRNGSKVGLVGRTGAGKSSFVQSLFRMVHVHGGDIRFGEASLLQMPIDQARALVAVVPQDPYLFEGTIRSNIDRLSECSNEVLQEALRKVQLSVDLDKAVLEGGSNLSLGERQLLCLARVIISKRPIVVMDEPTSGVDTITDAIIQSVLRTALHDRTIITIAHRLETLARMDRIIELHDGAIIRDGKPADILPRLTPEELA
jgi:ABC-type multidrug transport system fused ATPase/permease subunit